jgi:hypothetical protein
MRRNETLGAGRLVHPTLRKTTWAAVLAVAIAASIFAGAALGEAAHANVVFVARRGDPRGQALWLAVEAHLSGMPIALELREIDGGGDLADAGRAARTSRDAAAAIWLSDGADTVVFESAEPGAQAEIIPVPAPGESWAARCAMTGTLIVQRVERLAAVSPPPRPERASIEAPAAQADQPVPAQAPPGFAPAEAAAPLPAPARASHAAIAMRLGIAVPISALSPFLLVGLDIEAVLPLGARRVSLALDTAYTRPSREGRASAGALTDLGYELTVHEVKWSLDAVWRFYDSGGRFAAYLAGGPLVQLLAARERTSLGDTSSVRGPGFGGAAAVGAILRMGPGGAVLEARYAYSRNDVRMIGNAGGGEAGAAAGYRFEF